VKFVDTSWWAAWAWPRDRRHAEAAEIRRSLAPTERLVTTNLVMGECWTLLRRRDSHRVAVTFLDRTQALVDAGRLEVQRVEPDQEVAAWTWLRRHDEREYSFVDATSFRVTRDRRVREALAFDSDFSAAGFIELRA
jgi:predicted nucleic acid-binding protein